MNETEIIQELCKKHSVTIDQWRDQWGHWRVGLDWWGEGKYTFLCERPTLKEALEVCIDYVNHPSKYL